MGKSAERSSAQDGSLTCRVGCELRGRVGTPRRRICTAVGFACSGPKGSELRGTGMGMEEGVVGGCAETGEDEQCGEDERRGGGVKTRRAAARLRRLSEDIALWLHSCL
ncbi:hypothetical protein EV363DRAFT_1279450, partial [Boletus edulis]